MFGFLKGSWIRSLVLLFLVGAAMELTMTDAEARAGRGRSSGRSSGSGYGSRQAPPPNNQQAAPNSFGNQNPAMNPGMNPNRGGLLRGMAGGIAGGFLGSMLFSSLGHGAGGVGTAGGSGGIGILEILLFGGLAYLGFRWWKSRQQAATEFGSMTQRYGVSDLMPARILAPAAIDPEAASDLFFKVQGAWTRRDLTPVRSLLGKGMQDSFDQDLTELKNQQRINRLENIAVRGSEVTNTWQEGGDAFSTVRFTANLLDYTVDEKSGDVLEGSDSTPVKFEEEWTFSRAARADGWQLVGIQQV